MVLSWTNFDIYRQLKIVNLRVKLILAQKWRLIEAIFEPSTRDMSKKKFQDLKDLIGALKKEEIILAKKHLTAFESFHTRAPSKMLRLLNLILKESNIDFEKVKKLIGNDITIKSYNQLISRTLVRIEESLILDINLSRKKGYTPVFRNRLKIRKLIVQASILQGRGLANYALKNYNWIIRTAKKFELYDELIETLFLKQAIVFTKEGAKEYDAISK
mgnify:CR=1 FL=1